MVLAIQILHADISEELKQEYRDAVTKIKQHHYANYFQYAYRKNTYSGRETTKELQGTISIRAQKYLRSVFIIKA